MAHVQKRERAGTDGRVKISWRARYRDPTGREHSRSFSRKVDAERWLASIESAKTHGDWIDPAVGRTLFREWAKQWLDGKRRIKPKTRDTYASLLRAHILPAFGPVPLNRIQRADVERWVSGLVSKELSASRVRQAHQCLSAVLKAAVHHSYLTRNPAAGIELPRVRPRERRFLTADQVVELASSGPPEFATFVYVLAYGGLRFGEAVALRRRHCNPARGRLEIAESASVVAGELHFGATKNHRRGSVSLPRSVTARLAAHLETCVPPEPDALVFTSPTGRPLRNGNFLRNQWRPALATTSLPQDLTPHELRHTCAALLIAKGADPKAIQAQMRHSSISVTFDVYGHLFPGHLDDVLQQLDVDHRAAHDAARPR